MHSALRSRAIPVSSAALPAALADGLDCLRVAVTLYDAEHRLIYANRHYSYLFQAFPLPTDLLGRRYDDLVRLEVESGAIAPSSFALGVDTYIAQRLNQLARGVYEPRDILLADGRVIELKIRPAETGWIALWADATAARHAFGRLETAVGVSADAFAFWDRNDRLVLCNAVFARLHGSASEAALRGVEYRSLLESSLAEKRICITEPEAGFIERRMRAHRAEAGALTVQLTSGTAYLIRERATPDGGRATVLTDITDHTRTEAALAEQSDALKAARVRIDSQDAYLASLLKRLDTAEEAAGQAKATFLRTMSHELKTPLNAILGFSDMLRAAPGRYTPPQIEEYADLIHAAGTNLYAMLAMIMDLTKIAAGGYPVSCRPLPVHTLFAEACDSYAGKAEARNIAMTIDATDDLCIAGDESACLTLLRQLVANAVTFTQPGGHIVLAGRSLGAKTLLDVRDDGPGVAAEHLPRLTHPFEQAGNHGTAECGGAGLGLTLAEALAQLQGGRLELISTLGEGFCARVIMPSA